MKKVVETSLLIDGTSMASRGCTPFGEGCWRSCAVGVGVRSIESRPSKAGKRGMLERGDELEQQLRPQHCPSGAIATGSHPILPAPPA